MTAKNPLRAMQQSHHAGCRKRVPFSNALKGAMLRFYLSDGGGGTGRGSQMNASVSPPVRPFLASGRNTSFASIGVYDQYDRGQGVLFLLVYIFVIMLIILTIIMAAVNTEMLTVVWITSICATFAMLCIGTFVRHICNMDVFIAINGGKCAMDKNLHLLSYVSSTGTPRPYSRAAGSYGLMPRMTLAELVQL